MTAPAAVQAITAEAGPAGLVVTNVVPRRAVAPLNNGRFVVELASSGRSFSPPDVPHLDLFGLYHLYWHISVDEEHLRHSLRLGFFNEERTARAVAQYLASYFESPVVVRISYVEETQSAKHAFRAMKDVGASGQYAEIELTGPPPDPSQVAKGSVHAAKVVRRAVSAPPSLWSRLFGALHR